MNLEDQLFQLDINKSNQ